MGMHVHEVHAAVIHAPLVLLPAAAMVDLSAALSGDQGAAKLGRKLWWFGIGAGALAGLAGMAASQEVKTEDPATEDMMWRHGTANFAVLAGALGVALWRTFRQPSVAVAAVGLGASAFSLYSAYLGGQMVYEHGVGVRSRSAFAPNGVRHSPPVLSAEAPKTFLRDAFAGLSWLASRTTRAVAGRQRPSGRAAL